LLEIAGRGHMPIVTGGTGLYLRALTEGLFAGPERQQDLRARLESSRQNTEKAGCIGCLRGSIQLQPRGFTQTTPPS